ncbi:MULTISPECIES: TolC family protein [unclassified Paraburkholderia]|uniref:TolC family protein n=1 Tax=unclassified Paraburkholderia TaxID=2615204 RepID=UPI001848D0E8|nr:MULTISPECIES: TolC family protein [unclassified Paraburkholderia]MBB5448139.1 adhesin transport system outer membrane protein [Paraburkholderia sp. WSM4177]MBB5488529.1 adhesin transport system outer membrane protein [Paraburkholderia sp. WSM4180]
MTRNDFPDVQAAAPLTNGDGLSGLRLRPLSWLVSSLLVVLALPASAIAGAQTKSDLALASDAATASRSTPVETKQPSTPGSHAPPVTFSQWLETQPSGREGGPPVDSATLRRIFLSAVEEAEKRSPEVGQAYAAYEAAKSDVDEAKGLRWPQVDIGSQTQGVQFGPGNRNGSNNGNVVTANVTTTVYDWGRTKNTIGSREQLSDAALSSYVAARNQNAFEVTSTLVELGKQRTIVDVSQQFVERMATLVKMLSEIVAVDRGRGSELTQAKARLLQAEAARDSAQAKARDAELALQKLLGESVPPIPHARDWPLQPGNLPQLLERVNAHPSLHQIQSEANAADLNAKVVKASGLPSVNWVVSANAGIGGTGAGQRAPWQTMLTLNWAAFRGGSTQAATAAAGYRAQASWQRLDQQRRDLEYGIRTADQDAHTMLSRAEQYKRLSAETDQVRKAFFEQWYHLGKRTLLDVLLAENDHYGNSVSEVTNRFDGYAAVLREHASAGSLVDWLETGRSSG